MNLASSYVLFLIEELISVVLKVWYSYIDEFHVALICYYFFVFTKIKITKEEKSHGIGKLDSSSQGVKQRLISAQIL